MPQLSPGGKYVFGWAMIAGNRVPLPPEACDEYGLVDGALVILLSTSRTSGGFSVSTPELLRGSYLYGIANAAVAHSGRIARYKQHFCLQTWLQGGCVELADSAFRAFGLQGIERLLVIRGSNLAFDMAARGPLVERAATHKSIPCFTLDSPSSRVNDG